MNEATKHKPAEWSQVPVTQDQITYLMARIKQLECAFLEFMNEVHKELGIPGQ